MGRVKYLGETLKGDAAERHRWLQRKAERCASRFSIRARKYNVENTLTTREIRMVLEDDHCFYCGKQLDSFLKRQ
jgi:hypothetical protein